MLLLLAQGHSHMHLDSVVKMKSLPFDANQADIILFFEQYRLKPNGVQLVVRSDNKPTGEAFVDFESYEEASKAMREKDHKVFNEKFGDRYVRLIQVRLWSAPASNSLRLVLPRGMSRRAPAAAGRQRGKPEHVAQLLTVPHGLCSVAANCRCPARRCRPHWRCALAARAS